MTSHRFNGKGNAKNALQSNERVYSPNESWMATHVGDGHCVITHKRHRAARIMIENATATQALEACARMEAGE